MVFALSPESEVHTTRRPTYAELLLVLDSLSASRALLVEDPRKGGGEGERRVMMNLEEMEVLRVLGQVGGPKWRALFDT
jgi:origin recognition complex subunit 1